MHAPDYETLQVVKLARKLYQGDIVYATYSLFVFTILSLTPEKYIELHHRFLAGWRKFGDKPEVQQIRTDLKTYLTELQELGLKDNHVSNT